MASYGANDCRPTFGGRTGERRQHTKPVLLPTAQPRNRNARHAAEADVRCETMLSV
jgi:hypothetical protein